MANILSCAGQVVLDTSQVQWVLLQDINVTVGPVSNATVDRRGDMVAAYFCCSNQLQVVQMLQKQTSAELNHSPAQRDATCTVTQKGNDC